MSSTTLLSELYVGQQVTVPGSETGPEITFVVERAIGSGSFGVVFIARSLADGTRLAVKKVLQDRRYRNRELKTMLKLAEHPHPNIVTLMNHFYSPAGSGGNLYLNILMDYVPETVYQVTKSTFRASRRGIPLFTVKLYAWQLIRALAFCHTLGICHRDIKPQNLLVDKDTGRVVLCDFGSAKMLNPTQPNVSYICSRYYRAPELIFGSAHYTTAIDLWSAACLISEMLIGRPLFPGGSSVDQLVEIIRVLGTPTLDQVHAMNPNLREYSFPAIRQYPLERVFKQAVGDVELDFFRRMLTYDPVKRLTAYQALAHPFFDALRERPEQIPVELDLFSFTDVERDHMDPELLAKILPSSPHSSSAGK
eukprot:gnl/Dysnectes_brevis/1015_a1132_2792.p1 GENE.gnl/Dysnectes_brevis/1015_a1132_2792~~gnl/Dysnectes_brevis/1015_a1132_2792.p1  ORF type:complete len:365 (+),score=117.55 gnl/Dysnectes_brevis/1015_a1132_2792:98-1192(+)